jgi:hypothetical protein
MNQRQKQCESCNQVFTYDKQRDTTVMLTGLKAYCPNCGHQNDAFEPQFRKNQWLRATGVTSDWMAQCEYDSYYNPSYGKEVVRFKGTLVLYDANMLEVVPQEELRNKLKSN